MVEKKTQSFEFLVQHTTGKKNMNTSLCDFIYTHSKEVNCQYPKYLLLCISNAFLYIFKGSHKNRFKE